jgi:MFS transporter, NNP family, nitrate/nitrite transporter
VSMPQREIELTGALFVAFDPAARAVATPCAETKPTPLRSLRDASLATLILVAAIAAGSGGFASIDPALLGYLSATVVAAFGVSWRMSAFWRRPASAFYARALLASLAKPQRLRRTVVFAHRDLIAQGFIRRRSLVRWMAHLLLSLGTLASFAITVPLVCGWMHFVPSGERDYQMVLSTVPTVRFAVDGVFAWLVFHALSLAAVAVVLGATYFLVVRMRARRLPGTTASFAIAPLLLLLTVALTGLALPASREWPGAFRVAALLHQAAVVVLLVAIPFSKLGHILIRPLQLGARAVRAGDAAWQTCAGCGARLAPVAQQQAVAALLAQRGMPLASHLDHCQACRRRTLSATQAALIGGDFQPPVMGMRGGS